MPYAYPYRTEQPFRSMCREMPYAYPYRTCPVRFLSLTPCLPARHQSLPSSRPSPSPSRSRCIPTLSLTCRPACLLATVISFCFCLLHLPLLPSGFLRFCLLVFWCVLLVQVSCPVHLGSLPFDFLLALRFVFSCSCSCPSVIPISRYCTCPTPIIPIEPASTPVPNDA